MKRVAVLQSNYIPWKGYFDIIHDVDTFIFYDDVQFTKNDWRNRNKIKTHHGTAWLTIPVGQNVNRLICDVRIADTFWQQKHWKTLKQYYSKAAFFDTYKSFLEQLYLCMKWGTLSELNQFIIKTIAVEFLEIKTIIRDSRDYSCFGNKSDRLLNLLKEAGTEVYVSGPAARDYIHVPSFEDAAIKIVYKDYAGYPEYPQFYPPFTHNVSILDLLFQVGPDAPYYIWGWRERAIKPVNDDVPANTGKTHTDCRINSK